MSDRFFHTTIGQVVKAWRHKRGLTVTALAQQVGEPITKGYISQLEHDKIRQPSDAHLGRLANALSITVQDLVTRRMPDEPLDMGVRGHDALSVRGGEETSASEAVPEELDAARIAHDLAADPALREAYVHLKTALADPKIGPFMLQALKAAADEAARSRP